MPIDQSTLHYSLSDVDESTEQSDAYGRNELVDDIRDNYDDAHDHGQAASVEFKVNLKLNFSELPSDGVDQYPMMFGCSFDAFQKTFDFVFKYRSYAFTENTPLYMWNGSFTEKRLTGKVKRPSHSIRFFFIHLFILKATCPLFDRRQ